MRLARVFHDGDARYGIVHENVITLISDEPFASWEIDGELPLAHAEFLAPVIPTKIVCVGLNYKSHAKEMDLKLPEEPVIFLKPPTSINGTNGTIHIPPMSQRVDYEAELAVVMGRHCRDIAPDEAEGHILGYTCANDVTARDLQAKDGQWTRAKGFDGFCPLGPWVETELNPLDLAVEARVDGVVVQSARTSDMVFDVFELVSFVSQVMTLLPGDVVLTGTPGGIGPMASGSVVEVEVEGIGVLVDRVV